MFLDQESIRNVVPPPGGADGLLRALSLLPNTIIFATDTDGILTYTDGAGLVAFDAKSGDGIGQHIADFFRLTSAVRADIRKTLKGKSLSETACIKGRYFEYSFVPSFGSEGDIIGLVGFSTDITERHEAGEELLVQKELLFHLFNSFPEITHILDRDLNILMANRVSRNQFADVSLIGSACYQVIGGLEQPCPFCPVLKMYETGLPESIEYYNEQQQQHFELNCFPIRDHKGNIIGALEIAQNITEKKQAQIALQKNETLLQDLFSSISDGILVIDREYKVLRTNRAMDDMYPEHLPLARKKCFTASLCTRICPNCPVERVFELEKPVTIERYEEPVDNKPGMWLDHTAYPHFDKDTGELIGAICVIRDVTERKQVELELQEHRANLEALVDHQMHSLKFNEARLRSILETSSAAISFADWQGNFTYINKAYRELFGYAEDELYGRHVLTLDAGTEEERKFAIDALSGKCDQSRITTRLRTKEGQLIWADINVSVIRGADPSETQLISVIVDVTERQQVLEELRRAKTAAEDAGNAKSQFLATMSHEIRTPLNGVIGLSDLLLATTLQPKQLEYTKLIKASGDSLLFLINDILDFSKIEAEKLDLEHSEFDLHELVTSVMGIFAAKMDAQNLELVVTCDPKIPRPMYGDSGRIRQVLINLIGNGLKFTQQGGVWIHVSHEEIRDTFITVRFEITDTGIGIPEERLHRLFQPFSQVDASAARIYGGTGLGLAISRKLIGLMGGEVGVQSIEGEGSTFWLTVPLECSPEILECIGLTQSLCVAQGVCLCQRNQSAICQVTGRHAGLNLAQLFDVPALIVSANDIQRRALKMQFDSWGFATKTLSIHTDAWQAITDAAAKDAPYRLVVINADLDDGSGAELIDRLVHDDRLVDLVIIALVSLSDESANDLHHEKGVRYLTKPVSYSLMLDTVIEAFYEEQFWSRTTSQTDLATTQTFSSTESTQKPLRVLVAEDNRINQLVIAEILANAGIQYKIAHNGLEARNAVKNETFDAVLMDCQMPNMDGYEATIEIRNWEQSQSTPVKPVPIIALTANATKEDVEKCFHAGMDAYCSKPINPKRVIALIELWTARRIDKADN